MKNKQSKILINDWVNSDSDFEIFISGLIFCERQQFIDELKRVYKIKRRFINGSIPLLLIGWANFVFVAIVSNGINPVLIFCFVAPVLGQLLYWKERKSMLIWQNLCERGKGQLN